MLTVRIIPSVAGTRIAHREVGDVDRKGTVDPQRAVQRAQPRIRQGAARERAMLVEQAFFRRHFDEGPNEHREPRWWDNDRLDHEEPANFLRGDEHERELDEPVEEVAHHSCRRMHQLQREFREIVGKTNLTSLYSRLETVRYAYALATARWPSASGTRTRSRYRFGCRTRTWPAHSAR